MRRHYRFTVVLGALLCMVVAASASIEALDELRWQARVLLLFAPDERDERVTALDAALDDAACRVRERDLVVGHVFDDGESRIGDRSFDAAGVDRLRERLQVGRGEFRVFLIGKDGGVKARYDQPPDLGAVFGLIDGMPMRRSESRQQQTRCPDDALR